MNNVRVDFNHCFIHFLLRVALTSVAVGHPPLGWYAVIVIVFCVSIDKLSIYDETHKSSKPGSSTRPTNNFRSHHVCAFFWGLIFLSSFGRTMSTVDIRFFALFTTFELSIFIMYFYESDGNDFIEIIRLAPRSRALNISTFHCALITTLTNKNRNIEKPIGMI